MSRLDPFHLPLTATLLVGMMSCASVPPQVAKTHQKEQEIIESLRAAHLAMVDAYIDKKLEDFERFFFNEYGPVYFENWTAAFEQVNGRPYDSGRDLPQLYSDLVAEYQAESALIDQMRVQLREAIATEYRNALDAHQAVGGWLDAMEKLNSAQRQSIDTLLGSIQPGLSLDLIDDAVVNAKQSLQERLETLTN